MPWCRCSGGTHANMKTLRDSAPIGPQAILPGPDIDAVGLGQQVEGSDRSAAFGAEPGQAQLLDLDRVADGQHPLEVRIGRRLVDGDVHHGSIVRRATVGSHARPVLDCRATGRGAVW